MKIKKHFQPTATIKLQRSETIRREWSPEYVDSEFTLPHGFNQKNTASRAKMKQRQSYFTSFFFHWNVLKVVQIRQQYAVGPWPLSPGRQAVIETCLMFWQPYGEGLALGNDHDLGRAYSFVAGAGTFDVKVQRNHFDLKWGTNSRRLC